MTTNIESINLNKNTKQEIKQELKQELKMDENNIKAFEILKKEGPTKAAEFMFKHPTEKNENGEQRKMSYSEMRSFYG
jgi:mannose/fructose/N-acetylgalactosamine-specific phosphotransferase system component IIB